MSYAAIASAHRVRSAAEHGLYAGALGVGAAPVLAANGGYFPTSWGWAGAALAWVAVFGAVLGEGRRPSRLELAWVGGLAAFAIWLAFSLVWTTTESGTAFELQRLFVYVAGALAVVTIVRSDQAASLVGGVCVGVGLVCLYALSTRLFPTGNIGSAAFAGSRLSTPVSYWNGLGLVAGTGAVLALGLAARSARTTGRVIAAASVPLFLATLYFTFSRGGWISFFAGLAVLVAVDRRRLQLLGVSTPTMLLAAFAIWRASRQSALTHTAASALGTATHQGRTLAAIIAGVCLVAGYGAFLLRRLDGIWDRPSVAWPARFVVVAVAAIAVVAVLVRFGSPITIVRHGYDSFVSAPHGGANLNSRVFSLSNNGRVSAWKVAWHAFEAHPGAGLGAGGFAGYWALHRTVDLQIQDAHSLYLETLAETGIVGALLLFGTLLVPFAAFRRARENPVASAALAGYTMFLVHAIADWDWELAGVTLTAILLGGAVLAMARTEREAAAWRWPALGLGSLLAVVALLGLAGNLLTSASVRALRASNVHQAASDAHRATLLAPWSAPAWQHYAEAQLALGRRAQAQAAYRQAITRDPHNSQRWIDLALASSGAAQKAALDRAQALNPRDTSIADIRGQLGGK